MKNGNATATESTRVIAYSPPGSRVLRHNGDCPEETAGGWETNAYVDTTNLIHRGCMCAHILIEVETSTAGWSFVRSAQDGHRDAGLGGSYISLDEFASPVWMHNFLKIIRFECTIDAMMPEALRAVLLSPHTTFTAHSSQRRQLENSRQRAIDGQYLAGHVVIIRVSSAVPDTLPVDPYGFATGNAQSTTTVSYAHTHSTPTELGSGLLTNSRAGDVDLAAHLVNARLSLAWGELYSVHVKGGRRRALDRRFCGTHGNGKPWPYPNKSISICLHCAAARSGSQHNRLISDHANQTPSRRQMLRQ